MLNLQQGHSESESHNKKFHYVYKFVLTQQLLKSDDLLMESGDVVMNHNDSCQLTFCQSAD